MPTWSSPSRIYRHENTTGQMQACVTSVMADGMRKVTQKEFNVDCSWIDVVSFIPFQLKASYDVDCLAPVSYMYNENALNAR